MERGPNPDDVEYGELPELTRALHALGSSRRGAGSSQSQFFHPLIEARRRAADARTPSARVAAFNAGDLTKALDRVIDRIITEWPDKRESVRRAMRAEMQERTAGYASALNLLAERAADVASADDATRLALWRAWTAQLAATFVAADRAWLALRSVVEALPKR
jgi:hypothetical protein